MSLTKATYSMIQDAPADIVNYGADPTGTNDSTAAINAAVSANTNIFFPPGIFLISSPILLRDGVQIFGSGVQSRIQTTAGFVGSSAFINQYKSTTDQIITQLSLKNFYLYCPNNNVQIGLDFEQIHYSVIDTVEVDGFSQVGIYFNVPTMSADYNTVLACIVKNNLDGIRLLGNANTVRVYSCTFTNNTRYGIYAAGGSGSTIQTLEVIGGSVESSGNSGIYIEGRGCTVLGMHVEGNGKTTSGAYGIQFANTSFPNNTICGCYFYNNGTTGFYHVNGVTNGSAENYPSYVFGAGSAYQSALMGNGQILGRTGTPVTSYTFADANGGGITFVDTTNGVNNYLGAYNSQAQVGAYTNHDTALISNGIVRAFIGKAGIPVYADNTTAAAAGVAVNQIYRTSTGQLMIRY